MDENLAWLTRKTEDPKSNKGTLLFPRTQLMWLNCKVIEKWQPPHFYLNPPFSGLSPFSSKKFVPLLSPQVTQFLEGLTLIKGGGEGGFQLCILYKAQRKSEPSFSFVSNAMNFLIHSLAGLFWKKKFMCC